MKSKKAFEDKLHDVSSKQTEPQSFHNEAVEKYDQNKEEFEKDISVLTLEKEQLVNTVNDHKKLYECQIVVLSSQSQILNSNNQQMILLSDSDQVNIEEASPKVIESTRGKDKDSTTGVGNMFHSFLGRIEGKIQWCIILLIILVLVYISHPTLLKFSQRKTPNSADQTNNSLINSLTLTAASPLTSLKNLHSPQNGLDDPTPTPEQTRVLPLLLASFTLNDASASQGKPGVVIPIIISSQNGQIPCSILIDTGFSVTPLSEKLQSQLKLPAMLLDSHYYLVGAL